MKSLLPRRTVILLIIAGAVNWLYPDMNRLSCYGVDYVDTVGGSETFNSLLFFRTYPGTRIKGPEVTGSLLYVTYQDFDHDGIPEIVVKSRTDQSDRAVIKLNLSHASKPAFEVLEHTLTVGYAPQGLPGWP